MKLKRISEHYKNGKTFVVIEFIDSYKRSDETMKTVKVMKHFPFGKTMYVLEYSDGTGVVLDKEDFIKDLPQIVQMTKDEFIRYLDENSLEKYLPEVYYQ